MTATILGLGSEACSIREFVVQSANTDTLSPEAAALLNDIRAQGFAGWSFMTIPQMREMMMGLNALAGESNFAGPVEEARISEIVTAVIYRQPSAPAPPLILYFHPGGFVAGDAKGIDGCVRRLAHATGASVASVNYRLAPEHKFPAALEDAYAAVQWAADRGRELGWDPHRIIVGGDSAGGSLSAAVCQLTRERRGPRLIAQLLVGALLDSDLSTESHREFGAQFGTLTSRDVDWFLNHYVNSRDELSDPRVSPLRASDLSGLPPAVIIVGALDPLRDEAIRYAERLREAGVHVDLRVVPRMFHGFWLAPGVLPEASEAMDFAAERLRRVSDLG
jgi:acetyl esterase